MVAVCSKGKVLAHPVDFRKLSFEISIIISFFYALRYRNILDNILKSSPEEVNESLKVFIEAGNTFFLLLLLFIVYLDCIEKILVIIINSWMYSFCAVVNDSVSLVISRQILTDVTNHLTKLPDELSKSISHFTLDKVSAHCIRI